MKKLLLGTFVLLAFNAAVIITQMSCKKEAKADTNPPTINGMVQLNRVLVYEQCISCSVPNSLIVMDYSGQPQRVIQPFNPPTGYEYRDGRLSPDGKYIFFSAAVSGVPNATKIFRMNIDGTEMKEIRANNADSRNVIKLEGVY